MDNKYKLFNTSDRLVSEILFKLSSSELINPMSFISRCFCLGSIEPFRFVARYLVNNVSDPTEAKKLLDRYIVAAVYATLRDKNIQLLNGLRSTYLDDIFENGLTIEKLKEDIKENSLFIELINAKGDIGSINKEIFDMVKNSSELLGLNLDNYIKNMKKLIYYKLNFFNTTTDFQYYKDSKRTDDLLIAEARSSSINREFSFDIPADNGNYDDFLKNVLDYDSKDSDGLPTKYSKRNIKDSLIIIAHLVNEAIVNDLPLNRVHTINSSEVKVYELDYDANLTRGNNILERPMLNFLVKASDSLYYPELDRINSFRIRYNNELYLISSDGIKRI